jgi:hypothetical protein
MNINIFNEDYSSWAALAWMCAPELFNAVV